MFLKAVAIIITMGFMQAAVAGPVRGSLSTYETVQARDTDVYNVSFEAGSTARVRLVGDRDTDLDLFVYDENGNLVCSAVTTSDREACSFTPRWTGRFRVEVRNLGHVWNRYHISMT